MKLSMFTSPESYVRWLTREVDALTANGLRQARESLDKALRGESKETFFGWNPGADESSWLDHIAWLEDRVTYLEKKISKYQREISKYSI